MHYYEICRSDQHTAVMFVCMQVLVQHTLRRACQKSRAVFRNSVYTYGGFPPKHFLTIQAELSNDKTNVYSPFVLGCKNYILRCYIISASSVTIDSTVKRSIF